MNAARKSLQAKRCELDAIYWNAQRALLLAEGTAREQVNLTPAYNVPTGLDEPKNTPNPNTRKTAQIPWAKNYVTGRTRALIVTTEGASWDAYELLQRMDLDAEIFYCTVTSTRPSGRIRIITRKASCSTRRKRRNCKSCWRNRMMPISSSMSRPRCCRRICNTS